MNLLRWLPISSTIFCLFALSVGTLAHPLEGISLFSTRHTNLDAQDSPSLSKSVSAKAIAGLIAQTPSLEENTCPPPILERLSRHKVLAGDTLESIAEQYNLVPATLTNLNPGLPEGAMLSVGSEVLIPPFNGIRIQVPAGSNWKDLATTYGVRAELLFEVNGCKTKPQQLVFLPGVNWSEEGNQAKDNYSGFAGYPLPSVAPVGLSYGWQENSGDEQVKFHPGIDLLADIGTPVLSVDPGTVAFAGEQGSYGNLVVVNHQGGRQSRYAHLASVIAKVGQQVQPGDTLGTVGNTGIPDISQPHLHFEVRYNSSLGWVAQNPELHLRTKPTENRG